MLQEAYLYYPDLQDGLSSLFCIYLAHAQRGMDYKLDLRDKLENSAGCFVSGSILKSVDRIMPVLEVEALQMKVNVQYDISVRRITRFLIERSPRND